jgi:hypothetical protein
MSGERTVAQDVLAALARCQPGAPTIVAQKGMVQWLNIPKECPEQYKREVLRSLVSFFLKLEDATMTDEEREERDAKLRRARGG